MECGWLPVGILGLMNRLEAPISLDEPNRADTRDFVPQERSNARRETKKLGWKAPVARISLISYRLLRQPVHRGICDNDHTQVHAILTLPDSESLGFDMTFAHGPTLHFLHYVGQSGSSSCPSTPTNATYKNCKHSTTRLVLSLESCVQFGRDLNDYFNFTTSL